MLSIVFGLKFCKTSNALRLMRSTWYRFQRQQHCSLFTFHCSSEPTFKQRPNTKIKQNKTIATNVSEASKKRWKKKQANLSRRVLLCEMRKLSSQFASIEMSIQSPLCEQTCKKKCAACAIIIPIIHVPIFQSCHLLCNVQCTVYSHSQYFYRGITVFFFRNWDPIRFDFECIFVVVCAVSLCESSPISSVWRTDN